MKFVPEITQEFLKDSANERYVCRPWEQVTFEDSKTTLICQGNQIRVSFDGGRNWKTTLEVSEAIDMVSLDKFHRRDKAFAEDIVGNFYVTESQGKEWLEIQRPSDVKESYSNTVESHPLSRNCLLLNCDIEYGDYDSGNFAGSKTEERSYLSTDCGMSFKRIAAPVADYDVTSDMVNHGTECWFAFATCRSTLPRELIYGLHSIWSINEQGFTMQNRRKLFFSPDMGNTTKLVEELKNVSVRSLHILSAAVLVTTAEEIYKDTFTEKLWLSTGGPFKEALLPGELKYSAFGKAFEDDLGRLLLPAYTTTSDDTEKFAHLLMSDYSVFKLLNFESIPLNVKGFVGIEKFGNCEGSALAKVFGVFSQDGEVSNHVSLDVPENSSSNRRAFKKYMSVITFDNGNNWSRPRLIDHSNKLKKHFKCNINELKNSYLHIFNYNCSRKNNSMKNVYMAKGAVTHSELEFSKNHCMSFISRDAGANWELAFPFPVYSVFADVGKIVVAVPQEQEEKFSDFYISKVFYSLNQGISWGQYELEQPVFFNEIETYTSDFSIDVIFLKLTSTGRVERERSILLKLDFLNSLEESK